EKALFAALRPGKTKVIVGESPTNPYLRVADLAMFCRARDACPGSNLLVDATFATPVNQRPLESGADLVIHSATKYLGGHLEQPAYMSYFELTTEEREAIGIFDDLVRLSVGLEDSADVIADLAQALDAAFAGD